MKITKRPLKEAETKQRYREVSIFARQLRRQARAEIEAGEAEELEFEVVKAWKLITCEGPPCCPNGWLVRTRENELVYLQSWFALHAADGSFPGSRVVAARLPLTHRLVDAVASGKPVPAPYDERLSQVVLGLFPECEIIPVESLPPELAAREGL